MNLDFRKSSGNTVCLFTFSVVASVFGRKTAACEEFDRDNFPGRKVPGIRRVLASEADV